MRKGLIFTKALLAAAAVGTPAVLVAQEAPSAPSMAPRLPLGPGDVVEISLLGVADSRVRATVRENGQLPIVFLGEVQAAGKTPDQLAREIEQRLRAEGVYSNPLVNLEVVSTVSSYVTVFGPARTTGLVPLERAYRLSELIARVGPGEGAGSVVLITPGQPQRRIAITDLASGAVEDPVLSSGDRIQIVAAEFFIYGQVNSPGGYPVMGEPTVRKALARGGGLSPLGTQRRVRIFRDGQELRVTDLETAIRPGDVIHVGERLF